jgi:hypothetical protein
MVPTTVSEQVTAVSPLRRAGFRARVASVRAKSDELTLILRSGLEVRLGDATGVRLKLAVVAKVLPLVAADTRYLDVSVPERPVAGSIFHAPGATATSTGSIAATATQASTSAELGATPTLNSQVEVDGAGSTGP